MFYDFNGSTANTNNNTAQNFYQSNGQRQNYRQTVEGDRVPTRERCYRSAQNNLRRRLPDNANGGG